MNSAGVKSAVRLLWSPLSLAETAFKSSNAKALCLFYISVLIECGLPFAILFKAHSSRVHSTVWHFALNSIQHTLAWGVALFLVFLVPTLTVSGLFFKWTRLPSPPRRPAVVFRILFMAPVCVLLPASMWTFLFAVHEISMPTFWLLHGAKPAWFSSTWVTILASPWWWMAGLLAIVANAIYAMNRLGELDFRGYADAIPRCRVCDYRLTGLIEPRCPECGTPF